MQHSEDVTFGGPGLDRAAHFRNDWERLRDHPDAAVLPLWRGKPLMSFGDSSRAGLGWLPVGTDILSEMTAPWIFLGLAAPDGAPRFAVDVSVWSPPEGIPETSGFHDTTEQHHPLLAPDLRFAELRAAMTRLEAADAATAATARAMLEWHRSHGFCAGCGARSTPADGGWKRTCPACGRSHFPRTDPVVIMLVTHGNAVLLGRSPHFPEGMYSLLAGFIEPGETVEAAVRRETYEETGVEVGRVDYLASQPWPFPASLMIGCRAEARSRDIRVDRTEIEDALWLPREEMMQAAAGAHPHVTPARPGAIAQFLLTNWLADTLD